MPNVAFNVDYEDFLSIQGKNSHFNMYYQIDTPFSFVLETYDDKSDEAYINMASFTPNNIKHTVVKDPAKIMAAQNRCLHQHDFYELMFVLEGKVINCIENTQHIYTKGSGCLLNRNLRHAEKFEGSFRVFFLNLSKEFVQLMLDSTSASYFHEELSVSQNELFQFLKHNQSDSYASVKEYLNLLPVSDNTYAYNLIYEMGENLSKIMLSPSYGSTYLVNGFIASILAILSNHSSYHITNMKVDYGNDFLIFSQASHLIEDANGIISREDLSKKLSYSGDYINRVIKKYSGVNLTKYCMNLRLIHAQTLLRNTNLSISDISFQLGFKNRTHFYKLFKEKYGKIPSEIRS